MATDPRIPVDNEISKVLDKFSAFEDSSMNSLDDVEEKLSELLEQLDEIILRNPEMDCSSDDEQTSVEPVISSEQVSNMTAVLTETRDACTAVSSRHRELHSIISKVGRAIDKNFVSSYEFLRPKTPFLRDETRPLLHEVMCNHLCRQGMQDTAEQIMTDTDMSQSTEFMTPFAELNRIVAALRERDLTPAMEWAAQNREKLEERKSCLEFKLRRQAFIGLLASGGANVASAVQYAREYLKPYVNQHQSAIQLLMGALVFMKGGLEKSPYSDLLHHVQWHDLILTFTKEACAVMGHSVDSPLAICINAGCAALPVLLNIKRALNENQVTAMWTEEEELPIEISAGECARYHSRFACPILRQQSTEVNPPMRLLCGHVISKNALNELAYNAKVKCPYCPVEQSIHEPQQIVF